ncbi:tssc1 homolog, putative [Babesia ovata]|uniref:Tssc1 homolog, putative n=1 Tax=Babesia ovata TaxID=189622 RepID=A0A2H6KHU5_9APIC|nr:tssc1 homolog, putative [Babesia ovata]GBE62566.1 tssc1 homolog, putative [Babesia ovata]
MQILDSDANPGGLSGSGVVVHALRGRFNTVASLQSSEPSLHRFAAASSDFSTSNRIVVVCYDEDKNAASLVSKSPPLHPVKQLLDISSSPDNLRFVLSVRDIEANESVVRIVDFDTGSPSSLVVTASSAPLESIIRAIDFDPCTIQSPDLRVAVVHPGLAVLLQQRDSTLEPLCRFEPPKIDYTTRLIDPLDTYKDRFITGKFDPHHRDIFACASGEGFHVLDWRQAGESPVAVRNGQCHFADVLDIAFNPNVPNQLVTAGEDGKIAFWDLRATYEPTSVLEGDHKSCIQYIRFNSFHDQLILSGGPSATLLHLCGSSAPSVHQCSAPSRLGCWSSNDAWHFASLSGNNLVFETLPNAVKYKLLL